MRQEIERDMDFDKIESPEDVMLWMAVGLPATLYNSSTALPGLGFEHLCRKRLQATRLMA